MRKYLIATAIGAMLIAGQAAATDSAVVNLGDRIGSQSDTANGLDGARASAFIILSAALLGGLLIWGFTEGGHQNAPARRAGQPVTTTNCGSIASGSPGGLRVRSRLPARAFGSSGCPDFRLARISSRVAGQARRTFWRRRDATSQDRRRSRGNRRQNSGASEMS